MIRGTTGRGEESMMSASRSRRGWFLRVSAVLILAGVGFLSAVEGQAEQPASASAGNSPETIAVYLAPCDFSIIPGQKGTDFVSTEAQWLNQPGEPQVPWRVVTLLLPPDADLSSVAASLSGAYEPLEGTWTVEPAPPPATRDKDGQEIILWPPNKRIVNGRDADIYERNDFWPQPRARVIGTGKLRAYRLADVAVPLVRYNPVSGALIRLCEGAGISLAFQRSAILKTAAASKTKADWLGKQRVQGIAANFAQVSPEYDSLVSGSARVTPEGMNSKGYFILTTAAVQSASTKLAAFVAHKQALGYTVQIVTETSWGGGSGDAAADNIRAWLKAHYAPDDIKYVLLIGNPAPTGNPVPMKMCTWRSSDNQQCPSDYFYADLSGTWDLDDDGYFGEDGDDLGPGGIDRYWEVVVARIPYYGVISDLDHVLQKTMDYENATDSEKAWRRNVLLPYEPLDESTQAYEIGENIKDLILNPAAIPFHRVYERDYGLLPPPETTPCTVDNVTNAWKSKPFGLVVWGTHGWSRGGADIMDTGHVPQLDDNYPSAVYEGSCDNAWPEDSGNIAYSLLRHGGIATIGATRNSWYYVGQTSYPNSTSIGGMGYEYTKRLVQGQTTGEAWHNLRQNVAPGIWQNYEIMNMYGDPSLKIIPPASGLTVSPTEGAGFLGSRLGATDHLTRTFTLKNNNTTGTLEWNVTKTASWLNDLTPANGAVPAGGSQSLTVSVDPSFQDSPLGRYTDTLTFTDVTSTKTLTRPVILDVAPGGLEAYWKMDDAVETRTLDSTGHGYDGNARGGISWVAGQIGGALRLDGSNDYVAVPALNLNRNTLTITGWIRRNGNQSAYAGIVFSRDKNTLSGFNFGTSNELRYRWTNTYKDWSSGLVVPDNRWTFAALVIQPTKATIYMRDASSMRKAVNTGTHKVEEFDGAVCIGQDPAGGRFFNGDLDDIRVYTYPMSEAEIAAVYAGVGRAECPFPSDGATGVPNDDLVCAWIPSPSATSGQVYMGTGYSAVRDATTASPEYKGSQTAATYDAGTLSAATTCYWRVDEVNGPATVKGVVWTFSTMRPPIGRWKMNEGSGATIADSSGNNRTGTLKNGPVWVTGPDGSSALSLDGGNDYVSITPNLNLNANTMSIVAWVKRNGDQNEWAGVVFCRGESTCAGLDFGSGNAVRYHWNDGQYGWNSNLVPPDNQWSLAALVVEPAKATIYLHDGTLKSAVNSASHAAEEFDSPLVLGCDPNGGTRYFKGALDDVAFYDCAVGPLLLNRIYETVFPRPPDPAGNPSPPYAATAVPLVAHLTWTAGARAASHDVYFGTTNPPAFRGNQTTPTYDPGPLTANTTYYWRVDEKNSGGATAGSLCSFTTLTPRTSPAAAGNWMLYE